MAAGSEKIQCARKMHGITSHTSSTIPRGKTQDMPGMQLQTLRAMFSMKPNATFELGGGKKTSSVATGVGRKTSTGLSGHKAAADGKRA